MRFGFVLLLSLFHVESAIGQSSIGATLAGVVSDESGARLPGSTVTLTNTANGRIQTFAADSQGQFRAVALSPAPYRIRVEHAGFAPSEQEVPLSVGAAAMIDVTLTVAGRQAEVRVRPASLSFSVAKFQPSSLVSADDIKTLPEIGRSFLALTQLLPGSGPLNTTVTRFATTRFGGSADQRSGFTTIVDGGDVDDAQWGSPTINLTQDSVQEFRVFRHQFDAQYGGALDAVVSVVTRAGGNRVDGSAFYFGRDDSLNARNSFAQQRPPFDEQRLGGAIGGPLAHDRSHYFAAFEHDHVDTARIIALSANHPFASRENGVFPARANERAGVARLDHRWSDAQTALLRYAHNDQTSIRNNLSPTSDSSQVNTYNHARSIVGELDSVLSPRAVNTLRVHWFSHVSGGTPTLPLRTPGIQRPSVTTGQTVGGDWQDLSRTRAVVADTTYLTRGTHDVKVGGEMAFGRHTLDAHYFEDGFFVFRSDAAFDPNVQLTWPTSFQQQAPNVQRYRARQFALFLQDDWRLSSRLRLNLGLRYDLDPTLRLNDFYSQILSRPALTRLSQFVSSDRGSDANNLQPRLGATYDLRGDGTLVLRGGWGMYVARNRPWFQLRSLNQLAAPVQLVEDPARLRLYPDVAAIVAGGTPLQLGTVIPDDFVQAYALNTTVGAGWQFGRGGALDLDYVHTRGAHQTGFTDRNLPVSGAISAANPRPVPEFAQVLMLENFTDSWYDALETQFRIDLPGRGRLHASHTWSRSYMDGVDFFNTARGTQRTPQERGFNPSDQRQNLTASANFALPWQLQVSGIVKLISGSPMPVQAGFDLDGDRSPAGDRPRGLPITVGRSDNENALRLINELRASLALAPIDPDLLQLNPHRSFDVRVTKSLTLRARHALEITLEVFNLTNHVNYNTAAIVRNINSPAFLERRTARDARQFQWGVRYRF